MELAQTENYNYPSYRGFIKIWSVDKATGEKTLLVDKPNTVLYQGADLLALSLSGAKNASISHLYVGYNNVTGSFTPPIIDKSYSVPFSSYGSSAYPTYGYLRLPLAYSPSYVAQTNYENNTVLFTVILSSSGNDNGATFTSTASAGPDNPASQIFEVGLVAALDPTSSSKDMIFSRANYSPLTYDPNQNLTITWGVQFLAQ